MTDVNKFLQNTASELNCFFNLEVQFTGKRVSVRPVIKLSDSKNKGELKLKLGI